MRPMETAPSGNHVMSTFGHIAQQGSATLTAMAPGVAAALITTVAGLLLFAASVSLQNGNRIAARHVPKPHGRVVAAAGYQPPVRG